jgi:hypothetical protein
MPQVSEYLTQGVLVIGGTLLLNLRASRSPMPFRLRALAVEKRRGSRGRILWTGPLLATCCEDLIKRRAARLF